MDLESGLKLFPDFPKKGINFIDISPLLGDDRLFGQLIRDLGKRAEKFDFNKIVAIESRGFILGSALALHLNKGFVMVRKEGKLPGETLKGSYNLEYGTDAVEITSSSIEGGERVLVMDDILATGGTVRASCELIEKMGGRIEVCLFFIELAFLGGRKLLDYPVERLLVRDF